MIDRPQFIVMLRERFPHVADMIDDCSDGLLHLEVATLGRATQDAIRNADAVTVRSLFQFVDEVFAAASPEVENAINVSYLEHIDFNGRKAKAIDAYSLLTPRLQRAVQKLAEY